LHKAKKVCNTISETEREREIEERGKAGGNEDVGRRK
jgi:hypothetical protein